MTLAQMYFLRRELHGRLDVRRTLIVVIQVTLRRGAAGRRVLRDVW